MDQPQQMVRKNAEMNRVFTSEEAFNTAPACVKKGNVRGYIVICPDNTRYWVWAKDSCTAEGLVSKYIKNYKTFSYLLTKKAVQKEKEIFTIFSTLTPAMQLQIRRLLGNSKI